jgi:ribonuclease HI
MEQGITDRRMAFCPGLLGKYDTGRLITSCRDCGRFVARCCPDDGSIPICHHYRLVFTDGSCIGNGELNAQAGIGIAIGKIGVGEDQWSIPVDDTIDSNTKRTSQRAELLAAIESLRLASAADEPTHPNRGHSRGQKRSLVIVSDSEYVVKGMTEWLPTWKVWSPFEMRFEDTWLINQQNNSWRTSRGTVPSNLDLFRKLDSVVSDLESNHNTEVGFWHVSREFNKLADSLARGAALSATG